MSAHDVFNTGGHGVSDADSWETFIDSDPVARFDAGTGFVLLEPWLDEHANRLLHDAVVDVVRAGEDVRCARDPGWQGPGQPWPGVHFAGFWLDESDHDDGVGPARWVWAPTLVRVRDPRGTLVELLCEDCAQAERDAAGAQGRCVPCWRGHHQGCPGEAVTDGQEASAWCACACRAPRQRVDPPEWVQARATTP